MAQAFGGPLIFLGAAPCNIIVAGLLTDRRNEFVSPIFSQPFDFECESVRTRNCWAVFLAIDRKAIADQDFSGMTLAEGRPPGLGNVFRDAISAFARSLWRQPVLTSRSRSLMTHAACRPFRARRNSSLGGWTGRIRLLISRNACLVV